MRTVSARVPDELFKAVQEFVEEKATNVNKLVAQALQGVIQGKIKMKPLGGRDICPRCAHTVHLLLDDSKAYFACLNCDWAAYLGKYSLPGQIEDLRGKIAEEQEEG